MTEDLSTPDTFGVRIGGLPVSMLDDLRSPELWRQVEAVLAGEDRLTAAAAELSDELFELIGREPAGKPLLVALRRSIHNRRPPARYWNDDVRALLPAGVADGVRSWLELTATHQQDLVLLDELIARHTETQHALLRKAVGDPAFRYGLVLSSPVLHDRLRAWLTGPEESAPEGRLALRLAKYLARITTKTTPFSTFTISGLGRWQDRAGAAAKAAEAGGQGGFTVRTVVELNLWLVQQLVRELSRHPALAPHLRLRLNPSALLTGDRWEFLGPGSEEPLRSLAASRQVRVCVDVVAEAGRTHAEAAEQVAARTGSSPATAGAYLRRLVELGLLEAERPFADQALDPLGELRSWVAGAGPSLAPVVGELDRLADLLAGYPALTDPADRLRHTRHVETALHRIRSLVGPERIEIPAKNGIIENALLVTVGTGPDRRDWAPVLRDLDLVRRCYALLDPALPGRVALAEAFAERIGPGAEVPFLAFHRAVQEWLREDGELPGVLSIATHGYRALEGHRLPRIRELARLRAQLCAEVLAGPVAGRGELRPSPQRLSALADGWPVWMRPPDSVAFYGQPLGGPGEPRFVINAVNSGHGRGRDRIRRLLTQAGVAVEADTAPPPGGVVIADTCRHYGANVGLRTSAVAEEIDYPGGLSQLGADHRVPVGDLVVRHDPTLGLLTLLSRGRGAEVRPVHPNLIAELWLPPAIRLLMQAFGATPNLLIPGRRMFGDTSLDGVDQLLAEPAVVIGRTTVSRRQWVFPVRTVPVRLKGETDRRYLLRLAAWLREHGMPVRCFVRALDPASVVGGSVWRIKSRKPLYVDFANLLLVGVFERLLAGPEHVLFLQEALPDPADAPRYGDHGSRVTEYLVEINGGQDADR
ncbi:lantibiotic dehydratase [Kitasatospora sp. HPMI-4]|uniref:lantibiotic dehydratase n=1 Tax=Kitasatospora sp. HPMI-4 TaxID=3448443 RepID=UPI003F1A63D1